MMRVLVLSERNLLSYTPTQTTVMASPRLPRSRLLPRLAVAGSRSDPRFLKQNFGSLDISVKRSPAAYTIFKQKRQRVSRPKILFLFEICAEF
jgi:hypothetical protein